MSERLRITILPIIIGLLLLGFTACPTLDAQSSDFPICLLMQYNICVYIDNPWDPDYDYDIIYNFTRWIDKENNILEYSRNNDGVSATFIQTFSNVKVELPGNPPIWSDVTTWEIGGMCTLSGINYEIHHKVRTTTRGGYYEWFLLWNVAQSANLVIKTMLGYHSSLGILVDYDREENSTDGSSPFENSDLCILYTNLYNYYPLIDDSQSTTTFSDQTTTSSVTRTTTSDSIGNVSVNIVIGIGIVIEILIIIIILQKRVEN